MYKCLNLPFRSRLEAAFAARRFGQALHCDRCARTFSATDASVDLTPTAGMEPQVFKQSFWGGTQLFRCNPAPSAHAGIHALVCYGSL